MKRLNFITQLTIDFLQSFIGCRKVLGKMPESKLRPADTFSVSDCNK